MSSAIDNQLWTLVRQAEPTASQKDGAQRSHNYLRELLSTGQIGTRIQNSYLSGSYARDTAIYPLDDVDVIFEIDPAAWVTSPFSGRPDPVRVLESFANAIRYRYPVSSVYGQRRSVRLELYHLDIDVVPAIVDSADRMVISVPDRDSGEWIRSSPKRHSENATRVNQKHGGRFKPLVKLLKFWNSNLPDTVRCKSFLIETIAVRLFDKLALNSLEEGVVVYWDFLARSGGEPTRYSWSDNYGVSAGLLGVSVPDAAGTGTNVAASMTVGQLNAVARKARISRERLESAQRSRSVLTLASFVSEAFRA